MTRRTLIVGAIGTLFFSVPLPAIANDIAASAQNAECSRDMSDQIATAVSEITERVRAAPMLRATEEDLCPSDQIRRFEREAETYRQMLRNYGSGQETTRRRLSGCACELTVLRTARERCVDLVKQRRAAREQAAQTASFEELNRIPRDYRLPAEQQRIEQEHARRVAAHEHVWSDPVAGAPLYAAMICTYQAARQDDLNEIRTQRSYARRVGGVIDLREIYDLQQHVRDRDEQIAGARADARRLHMHLPPCNSPIVRGLQQCLEFELSDLVVKPDAAPACMESPLKEYVDAAPEVPGIR